MQRLQFELHFVDIVLQLFLIKGGKLKQKKMLLQKREWCKGCGICVAFCPVHILFIDTDDKVSITDPQACIQCGQCELRCPDYAIFLQEESR